MNHDDAQKMKRVVRQRDILHEALNEIRRRTGRGPFPETLEHTSSEMAKIADAAILRAECVKAGGK